MKELRSRKHLGFEIFVSLMLSLVFAGCGGTSAPRVSILELTSNIALVPVSGTAHFQVPGHAATEAGEWMVNGISGGNTQYGTIDNAGTYKAPAVPPAPNSVIVTALGSQFQASGSISIVNPTPAAAGLAPSIVMQGSNAVAVTVTGAGFTSQSSVVADGAPAKTKYLSRSSLQATIPASALQTPGSRSIVVQTPSPGGGDTKTLTLLVMANGSVNGSRHPLVALYDLDPPRDAKVTIEFGPDTNYGRSTSALAAPAGGGHVEVQVAGMLPSTQYRMRAHIAFADGTTLVDADHAFTTGDVPAQRYANIKTTRFPGMTPSPGVELLNLISPAPGTNALQASAIDLDGRPIWYYDAEANATTIP